MRRKSVLFVAGVLGAALQALSVTADNPTARFEGIPKRNVFGLKQPEQKIEKQPEAPVPNVLLEGITTILGNKRALLKMLPAASPGAPAAPGQPRQADAPKETSLMLTEGQREGGVEVLQIDESAGAVKVNNSGQVVTLTFDKNGPKPPITPPSGPSSMAPGAATNLAGTQTQTTTNPSPAVWATRNGLRYPQPGTNGTPSSLPTRDTRIILPGTAANEQNNQAVPSPTGPVGVPPVLMPPVPGAQPSPVADQTLGLTPQQREALLEAQRHAMQYPQANLPNRGSGTFTTPPQQGIAPALNGSPPAAPDQVVPQ